MYTLYSKAGSCSTGITVLLEKLGVEFQVLTREDVPDYRKICPTNQVPALDTGSQIITEGAAIALYLLEKHENDMLPKDIEKKGEFLRWLMFNYATLHPAYSKVFAAKGAFEEGPVQAELMQKFADALSQTWKIIDERLEDRKYIVGDTPTIIDYLVTIYTSWNNYFPGTKVTIGKNIERLTQEISALPEFQAAYARENVEFKKAA